MANIVASETDHPSDEQPAEFIDQPYQCSGDDDQDKIGATQQASVDVRSAAPAASNTSQSQSERDPVSLKTILSLGRAMSNGLAAVDSAATKKALKVGANLYKKFGVRSSSLIADEAAVNQVDPESCADDKERRTSIQGKAINDRQLSAALLFLRMNPEYRQLCAENTELKRSLMELQVVLELLMSKYRRMVADSLHSQPQDDDAIRAVQSEMTEKLHEQVNRQASAARLADRVMRAIDEEEHDLLRQEAYVSTVRCFYKTSFKKTFPTEVVSLYDNRR